MKCELIVTGAAKGDVANPDIGESLSLSHSINKLKLSLDV